MNASECFKAGKLDDAIAAATDDVKHSPRDLARRMFLSELLCFSGQWQRADLQLDALNQQDPELAYVVALFRQLIRAEQARQQFYAEGRLPEFLGPPPAHLQLHLEASVCLRDGRQDEAGSLIEKAQAARPPVSGTCDAERFDALRDLDDLVAPLFEVLTTTGKYYWVPMERVESIEFHAPERSRDLLWRRAHMIVRGGPDGEVFLPVVYAGSAAEQDEAFRLGRATDWRSVGAGPTRGIGQRMFLFGEQDRSILELKQLTIDAATEASGGEAAT
jgi:type VI secretion system protein ImpE